VKVGIVCPYDWNVPSGVAIHVHDLAEALIGLGLEVAVLAPGDDAEVSADYVTIAGRSLPVPYNGSVARVSFGPRSASRVRRSGPGFMSAPATALPATLRPQARCSARSSA